MVECTRCGKVFKYESECKRHELSHLPGFGCNKCGKKFTYASALKRHQKQHERTGTVQCDKCNRSFKDEVLLKRHYKYAHEGTHICTECDAQFSSHQALRIHSLTHKPKSERRYSCKYLNCNKTFNFSHHLKYHEMTHTNNRQYFCKVCGKGFIQSHNLKVHMKVHEPSKWFFCEMADCKKKFNSESAQKRHHTRHKKESIVKESSEIGYTELLSEGIPCSSCGQLVLYSCSEDHKTLCTGRNIPITNDLSASPLPKTSEEECNVGIEKEVYEDINDSIEYVNSCRTVLGKCLVTGNTSTNLDCLCDQMVKVERKSIKIPEEPVEIIKALSPDVNDKNNPIKTCDDCACFDIKSTKEYTNDRIVTKDELKRVNHDCMPELEYGVNGIIKVMNTIDKDLEGIVNVRKNIKPKWKLSECDSETVPFNSCKAILGTCIVSGSGKISDDCLCAKMLVDEQQMTSQEMEDITPQPNDSTMCLL